jgi:dCMP deaminase
MVEEQARPSWDDYFKEMVQVCAKRSTCKRLHVGCLLVKDNRIISQGYNGYLPGCPHEQKLRDGHEIATVHAEQNAITDCAKRGVSSNDCIAYVTHYPCINCMKILCASGVKEINYINDYHNDTEMVEYFAKNSNTIIKKMN